MDKVFQIVPRAEIFKTTGLQFMQFNTLYQLYAHALEQSPALDIAATLLMTPDLFNYWLTGEKLGEFTIATTSQFYNPRTRAFATDLLEKLGLPTRILPPLVPPTTEIGAVLPPIAQTANLRGTKVVAPACHDTGSAVAAVPTRTENYAYISSGTWSLLGTVVKEPVISDAAMNFNFTNEGGVGGTFRLLKIITGLWLIQECRRVWAREGAEYSYDEIIAMAARAQPFGAFVAPDHHAFLNPDDMPQAIRDFCAATGQSAPCDRETMARAVFESLALNYRVTVEQLEKIWGRRVEVIHIVGGGSQNQMLCQMTADACARPVHAGPVEATAIGNLLAQAIAAGYFASWDEAREFVRSAFPLKMYAPRDPAAWEEAYARFTRLLV
jgi:rhamnulokinase